MGKEMEQKVQQTISRDEVEEMLNEMKTEKPP